MRQTGDKYEPSRRILMEINNINIDLLVTEHILQQKPQKDDDKNELCT